MTICSHPDTELVFRSLLNGFHRSGARPFHHHHEQDPALVPTANPAHAPAIDSVAYGHGLEQAHELDLDLHGHP